MSLAAPVGIVSGSGLDLTALLDDVSHEQPFESLPGLCAGAVSGHAYRFTHGRCGQAPVVLQQGRRHLYEGLTYEEATQTVEVLHGLGVRTVVLTSVVGGLLPTMQPGDLVAVDRAHVWPCRRWPDAPAEVSADFAVPGCNFTGIYCWMHGPGYETRAEIAALQALGGSVVGMSAAPELARSHELGMRAGLVACVTNSCCQPQVLTHAEVVMVARRTSARLAALLRQVLAAMASPGGPACRAVAAGVEAREKPQGPSPEPGEGPGAQPQA